MRGRTPKYRFGLYGPHSNEEFDDSAALRSSEAVARDRLMGSSDTRANKIASAGARNRGWSIVCLRGSDELAHLSTNCKAHLAAEVYVSILKVGHIYASSSVSSTIYVSGLHLVFTEFGIATMGAEYLI